VGRIQSLLLAVRNGLLAGAILSLAIAATANGQEDTLQFLTSGIDFTEGFDADGYKDIDQEACCGCRPWTLRGWLDAGLIGNTSSPSSKFNGPYNAVDRSNEAMFNQGYLIAERLVPMDGSWGTGGRLDLLYGEDFFLAQSAGFELRPNGAPHWNSQYYGLAIPQAYGEIGNGVVSVKAGHFYTPIGYEGVPAPNNFFYSKAYSYQFAGPFTHWGAMASAQLTEGWKAELGLVNGWNALDRTSDQLAEIALLRYTAERWWTQFAIITGNEFNNDAGLPGITPAFANRTRYSWIFDLQPRERWEYVFHQWFGSQADGTASGATAYWYGIDQYLYYRINDCWRSGLRFEWFRDEDGTRVGLNRPSNPNKPPFVGNFFSLTAGLNWTPSTVFTLRPEIRADWFDGNQAIGPFDDGAKDYQLMIGFDAIYLF
jgi:hypothetical protein